MSVFFIADTHFGDGNILRYENRPFATVEEMDQELVRRWNQKVGEKLSLIHILRVRQAINYAIDKDQIIDSVFGGYATKLYTNFSPVMGVYYNCLLYTSDRIR